MAEPIVGARRASRGYVPCAVPSRRPRRRANGPELAAALERHRGERLLILLTGYPDPDNIGSGLALQHLATQHDIESTPALVPRGQPPGEPRHGEAARGRPAAVRRAAVTLDPYSALRVRRHAADRHADPGSARRQDVPRLRRPPQEARRRAGRVRRRARGRRIDVRASSPTTCARPIPEGLNPNDPEHVKLATALMHGIRSDTRLLLEAVATRLRGARLSVAGDRSGAAAQDLGAVAQPGGDGHDPGGARAAARLRQLPVQRRRLRAQGAPRRHTAGGRLPADARRHRHGAGVRHRRRQDGRRLAAHAQRHDQSRTRF